MTKPRETLKAFEKRMKTITVPEGFTASMETESWGFGTNQTTHNVFVLKKEDDTELRFDHSDHGGGHTRFKTEKGWVSFDRTGVSDSFDHLPFESGSEKKAEPIDLNAVVREQLDNIAKRREYYKSAVVIPGLQGGWTVAPGGVQGLKDRLAAKNGYLTFTPSGFGTGYLVSKRMTRNCRYGEERAKPELEAFLGHSPLYVSTMDCD